MVAKTPLKKLASKHGLPLAELEALHAAQNGACAYCNNDEVRLYIDHIVPTSRSGSHHISNICFACIRCNSSKNNRTPEEWVNRWYLKDPSKEGFEIHLEALMIKKEAELGKKLGFTSLGKAIGVSQVALGRWYKGRVSQLDFYVVCKLMDYFGCSFHELVTLERANTIDE